MRGADGLGRVLRRSGVVLAGYLVYVGAVAGLPLEDRADELTQSPEARAGMSVWREQACVACHSVYGLGGHTGPDLTNVWSRMGEEYIRTVLRDGVRAMPSFALSEAEVRSLLALLAEADQTGVYPPPSNFAPVFGVDR
ncbi:MAG: cytochrome c [Leptolyngbya sp. PLA3]|nr:MAG: cytochrome c [Cyanobacteria bacterium CYA]MCE7969376.1 cytochrome c [Leptolyngbya sp. PL-A3]